MRKAVMEEIYKLAKKDKRVVFVGSDLGPGVMENMKTEMSDRFFMEGVSEQYVIGMCAGLAMSGKIVYFNDIIPFITRRAFEQVVLDISMHNLPVRLIGSGGGLVYSVLGPTHLAFDDIAVMRTVPNMTIVAVSDAIEMRKLIPQTLSYKGPIYIRLAKGDDPIVTTETTPFQIGKGILIKKGKDALIVTTGIGLRIALDTKELFQKIGLDVGILHMHTVKPLDTKILVKEIEGVKVVVTIEDGTIIGGLGSAVSDVISQTRFLKAKRFAKIGIPDVFPDKYGTQDELLKYYGITAENIVVTVKKLLRK